MIGIPYTKGRFSEDGILKDKIISEIMQNPNQTTTEISEKTGASASYVNLTAKRNGLIYGKRFRKRQIFEIELSKENCEWLKVECAKNNVGLGLYINACLNDARCE